MYYYGTVSYEMQRETARITVYFPSEKEKEEGICLPLHFPALVSLGGQDLTAIVGTASLASSMGLDGLAALGANSHAGSGQLPVGATALIAAGRGHFTLRDQLKR